MNRDLPLLAIMAADEIERIRQKKETNLENSKKLAEIIKNDFSGDFRYALLFKEVYKKSYSETIELSEWKIPEEYLNGLSNSLTNPNSLKTDLELKSLLDFCVNLSDYASLKQQDIDKLRGSCFR